MPRIKATWGEGDWVALPLVDGGGFALALLARQHKGCFFGYFFGPRRGSVPNMNDTHGLRPQQAALLARSGDLGLIRGEWSIIGRQPDYQREEWPMPWFRGQENSQDVIRKYSEDNIVHIVTTKYVTREEALRYPQGGLHGYLAMSMALDLAITEQERLDGESHARRSSCA
jgi:hypothetical protein